MKTRILLFFLSLIFSASFLCGQSTVVITDADLLAGGNYRWTADNVYVLDGLVVLEQGGELIIEPGTTVLGQHHSAISGDDEVSALVIARGSRLYAEGTENAPVIFSAASVTCPDPLDLATEVRGQWGGLIILGGAPLAVSGGEEYVAALPEDDRFRHGGDKPLDSSGTLRYVSIRHAGAQTSLGQLPGLYLGSTGSTFGVDHVEVFASGGSSFNFRGGTTNAYHLVAGYADENLFTLEAGYRGTGQFWFGYAADRELLALAGAEPYDLPGGTHPLLANLTLLGGLGERVFVDRSRVSLTDNAAVDFYNNILLGTLDGRVLLENRTDTDTDDSQARLLAGDINFVNNLLADPATDIWTFFMVAVTDENGTLNVAFDTDWFGHVQETNHLRVDPGLVNYRYDRPFDLNPLSVPMDEYQPAGIPLVEPGLTAVDYIGAFDIGGNWATWTKSVRNPPGLQTVHGRGTWGDACVDPTLPLSMRENMVKVTTDGNEQIVRSNRFSQYFASVPAGITTVEAILPNLTFDACPPAPAVELAPNEGAEVDVSLQRAIDCALPTVSVSTPFLMRGQESVYAVSYRNVGAANARNTVVTIALDPGLEYVSSNWVPSDLDGNTLTYNIGSTLNPFEHEDFIRITVRVPEDAVPGQEHCTRAFITADEDCLSLANSALEVASTCENGEVIFTVTNVGDQATPGAVPFVVVEDEVMLQQGAVDLLPDQSQVFTYPSPEGTLHFSTLAFPDDADSGPASATQSCADSPAVPYAAFPADAFPANTHTDCQQNVASFAGNQKIGFPFGVGGDAIVPPNIPLNYRVVFQNTEDSPVSSLVVIDSISPLLDMTTFRMETSSHPYTWRFGPGRTIIVTYDETTFPAATTDEAGSYGYFQYSIAPLTELPADAVIENTAEVYLSCSGPVRTQTTTHMILPFAEALSPSNTSGDRLSSDLLRIYPQPAEEVLWLEVTDGHPLRGDLVVHDLAGRFIFGQEATGDRIRIATGDLPAGLYVLTLRDNARGGKISHRFMVR